MTSVKTVELGVFSKDETIKDDKITTRSGWGDGLVTCYMDKSETRKALITDSEYKLDSNIHFESESKTDFLHRNLFDYLALCYSNHYNAILTPDMVWFSIMSELAGEVNRQPETYRKYFTDSKEKKTLLVSVDPSQPGFLNFSDFKSALKEAVPVDTNLFMPSFSTSDALSNMAIQAVFMDAVSPFYNYMMFMCGIPKIEIHGSTEDWNTLKNSFTGIVELMNNSFPAYAKNWSANVYKVIDQVINTLNEHTQEFDWKTIFYSKSCGSGSQQNVYGWIFNLVMNHEGKGNSEGKMLHNYPTQIAKVSYTIVNDPNNYTFKIGLTKSSLNENNFLIPEFGYVVNKEVEVKEQPRQQNTNKEVVIKSELITTSRQKLDVTWEPRTEIFILSGDDDKSKHLGLRVEEKIGVAWTTKKYTFLPED
jgi:hypothetical protein